MNTSGVKSLSKRALSGGSQARSSPSRMRPNKKPKERSEQEKNCSVCSELLKEKDGGAHKACTVPNIFVLVDGGKTRVNLKRNGKTKKFSCPRCSTSHFSSSEIQRHAKTHVDVPQSQHVTTPKAPLLPIARSPLPRPRTTSPATETASLPSSALGSPRLTTRLSRIRPPPPDTLQTVFLNRYGLIVNSTHNTLICLACQAVIDPTNIRQHFLKQHKSHPTPLDLQAQLDADAGRSYPHITPSPLHPIEHVEPIYGLEDPVEDYLQCNTCGHCFASTKTFDKHSCGAQGPMWTKTSAQRFVKNFTSPWFAVKMIERTSADENHRWASYQSQQNFGSSNNPQQSYSDEFRVLHQFLRNERWIQRVDNVPHEDLMHIVSYSTKDTAYGGLHYHVNAFLTSAQFSLDEPYLRRAIGMRPAEEQDTSRVRYHRDVNKSTLDHYSRTVAAMISFIHRVILNIDTTYTFSIPEEITAACNDLFQHFSPSSANEEAGMDEEIYDGDGIEESSGSSEDDEGQSTRQPHLRFQVARPTTPLMQEKIFNLLFLLFTQLPTHDFRGQFFTPIYHFLLLSSLRKNRAWAAANTITHTIAVVLFTGRLVFAWKIMKHVQASNADYSSAFATIAQYFEESSGAIMPRLYITKRGFTGLHSAEESTFLFNAPDLSGTSAIIDDKTLHLSQIKSSHLRLMAEIETELDALTFQSPQFTLPDNSFIHDSPRDRSPGYSFLKHPKNMWNHTPTLIQHIIESDILFARFAHITPSGAIAWIPSAIWDHMKKIHDLQTKFLCGIILSYGEPARGTELASHLLANVSGGSIRNIFVLFDIPVLRASFSKTTSMSGDKVIYRIPLPRLGRQFVRFLAYLRPAFIEWQQFLNPFMSSNAEHYLFPGLYRPLNAYDVSKVLASYTLQELNLRMKLRRYRQYMAFITSCNQEVFEAGSSISGATHEQFGHTAKINVQHYGRDFRTPDGSNFSSFMSAARVSGVFHILYGHPPDLLEQLEYGQGHITLIKDIIARIRNRGIDYTPLAGSKSSTLHLQDIGLGG